MEPERKSPAGMIPVSEVEQRIGVGVSTIYRWIREGHFPRPVKLGVGQGGRVRWRVADIDGWLDARGAELDRA